MASELDGDGGKATLGGGELEWVEGEEWGKVEGLASGVDSFEEEFVREVSW